MSLSTKIFEGVSNENKKQKLIKEGKDFSKSIPKNVITEIDLLLGDAYPGARWKISEVYDKLAIFDWWPEYLTTGHLKKMRSFLKTAISLGFDKYCCFKVGASGCANGMWASDVPTTDGYSPDGGRTLYKSFTPDYNYWDVDLGNGFVHGEFKSPSELKAFIAQETGEIEAMKTTEPEEVKTGTETVSEEEVKSILGKSVSDAITYLNELTGLTFNTSKINNRQMKLLASTDNYVVITTDKDKIVNIGEIKISK